MKAGLTMIVTADEKGVGRVAYRVCSPEDWFVSPVTAAYYGVAQPVEQQALILPVRGSIPLPVELDGFMVRFHRGWTGRCTLISSSWWVQSSRKSTPVPGIIGIMVI